MSNVLLKLLVKDKPLYSGKVHEEGKRFLRGEGNEVTADEKQTALMLSLITVCFLAYMERLSVTNLKQDNFLLIL